MENRKKRILANSEANFLQTGYGVYYKNVLNRLYSNYGDKFEIAELAGYANPNNPQHIEWMRQTPWKIYPVMPHDSDQESKRVYEENPLNQFGRYIWEKVCLDFQPDTVFSIKDHWYDKHLIYSSYRKFYNIALMPTVDAAPQNEEWISDYATVEGCFTYTDWAQELFKLQGRNKINLLGTAPPGADYETFKPLGSKLQMKQAVGLHPDTLIVGMVARNQMRKRFPDLFEAFARFMKDAPKELTSRTLLYIHTAWPDLGWDIPLLLKEFGLGNRVMFTYVCKEPSCGCVFSSFFQDGRGTCKKCGQRDAFLANSQGGIPDQILNGIYNLFDVYVQYSNCFAKATKIKTNKCWKNIEDIAIGDLVQTHKNRFRKVLRTFITSPKESCFKIKTWGNEDEIICSKEHPFLAITENEISKNSKESIRAIVGNNIRANKDIPTPNFYKISDLKIGDLIQCPIDYRVKRVTKFDLYDLITKEEHKAYTITNNTLKHYKSSQKEKPRYINIDKDFLYFVGLFAADGGVSVNAIKVTLSDKETENIKLCLMIMEKICGKSQLYHYKKRKAVCITGSSILIYRLFLKWFSKKETKQMPDWVEFLPVEQQKTVLKGLISGDGHCLKKLPINIYCTISQKMCEQVKLLCNRIGFVINCRLVNKSKSVDKKKRKNQYRIEMPFDGKNFITKRSSSCSLNYKGYYYYQIKKIEEIKYNDNLYNLEVEEDNSYITKIGACHNCEGFGIPVTEAACAGVPTMVINYSGMEDFVSKIDSIPIDIIKLSRECSTGRYFAEPDNDDFISKLIDILSLPNSVRSAIGFRSRLKTIANFNWDETTKKWVDFFDTLPTKNWKVSPCKIQPNLKIPDNLNNEQFVHFCVTQIIRRPDLINSYMMLRAIRDLNWGYTTPGNTMGSLYFSDENVAVTQLRMNQFNRENCVNEFVKINENYNEWEKARINKFKLIGNNN